MLAQVAQLLAWQAIPSLATSFLLSMAGRLWTTPSPRSPAGIVLHKMIYSCVLAAFFIYAFVSAGVQLPPNYYQVLGASPDMDAQQLNKAFRKVVVSAHPDRARTGSQELFLQVRGAHEALQSDTKRFAYERFGPDIIRWASDSKYDTMIIGLKRSIGFYIVAAIVLGVLKLNNGRKDVLLLWRALILLLCAALELYIIVRPAPPIARILMPNCLPFELVNWIHQVATHLATGLGQISLVWSGPDEEQEEQALLSAVAQTLKVIDAEAVSLIQRDVVQLNDGWPAPQQALSNGHGPFSSPVSVSGPASSISPASRFNDEMLYKLQDGMVFALADNRLLTHPRLNWIREDVVRKYREEQVELEQERLREAREPSLPPSDLPTPSRELTSHLPSPSRSVSPETSQPLCSDC